MARGMLSFTGVLPGWIRPLSVGVWVNRFMAVVPVVCFCDPDSRTY